MTEQKQLPTHAYVPGMTARHPEGCFDSIRDTARPGMTPAELAESDAFHTGLSYLDTGYYWEAHELLEPVWMVLPEGGDARQLVQALIQLANAQLKVRMQRPKAARRLCGITRALLADMTQDIVMGIEIKAVVRDVDSLERSLNYAV